MFSTKKIVQTKARATHLDRGWMHRWIQQATCQGHHLTTCRSSIDWQEKAMLQITTQQAGAGVVVYTWPHLTALSCTVACTQQSRRHCLHAATLDSSLSHREVTTSEPGLVPHPSPPLCHQASKCLALLDFVETEVVRGHPTIVDRVKAHNHWVPDARLHMSHKPSVRIV